MHDDLIDAVNGPSSEGIADPKKVAIMGGSYGGYATLVGLTFTPETFACGVDIVGPSNLQDAAQIDPAVLEAACATMFDDARRRSVDDPEGRELLQAQRSPLFSADKIVQPAADRPGRQRPARQAGGGRPDRGRHAREQGQASTYVLYPDEGHGFARPENRIDFNARAEEFLADTSAAAPSRSPATRFPVPRAS